MRLFVAITPPESIRRDIQRATEPLRTADLPVRWVGHDRLHLTLKFLGEVREERVGGIRSGLGEAAAACVPFVTRLGDVGAFPSMRRARVVWLGVEVPERLHTLKRAVERRMAELGFEADERAYHPHITLGRVRKRAGPWASEPLERAAAGVTARGEFEANGIELVRSRLGSRGATYSVVSRHGFRAA